MNKRERVLAALNNLPVDRPPVGFWFHFQADQGVGEACVKAHLDYYNHIDVDMVKIMCDSYFDYPNPVAKSVQSPQDWYNMQPLGPDSPFIREQVARAKAVKAGLKDDMVVIYNVFAPFSLIRFGTSNELVTRHLKEDPKAVQYALDVIAKDAALLSELLIREAGIDGIYYCVQGGEKDRMSVETYRELIGPSDRAVLEHANRFSENNVLHCCGWAGIPNHLEVWQDYPAKAINWACFIEDMDLTQGKAFFGGKCVLGGFDNRPCGVLFSGTREEVEATTRALVQAAGTTGVILGADCTLPASIDKERIGWVVDAVRRLA
ncbi:uroporphyrinogen decarboxylase family protein [Beduinella massiliensis]|uniref:uroporphyrinogen decarboxylase family protein n=1 Tax=Beduinella massiliensis TaxID=1852363 RepID=UPI000C858462